MFYLGGGFIWRWDDIVPAVLPAEKRLLHESCDDVEARFGQGRSGGGTPNLSPPRRAGLGHAAAEDEALRIDQVGGVAISFQAARLQLIDVYGAPDQKGHA